MYTGIYKIVDLFIEIHSIFPDVQTMCQAYRAEGTPDVTVQSTQAAIDRERQKSRRADEAEGIPVRNFSDGYLETLAVYRDLVEQLQQRQILLFHGSAVSVDGEAFLFTATSGTGKSTHTRLWREVLGQRAVMVNDDKPLLKMTETGVLVCGTPWDGKHRISNNISVPLKAICILERGEENSIREISAREALPMLMQQSYHPASAAQYPLYLSMLDSLTRRVKFYRLHCTISPEAARLSYTAMSGKQL